MLTWRERNVLRYLERCMEANSRMLGERLVAGDENPAKVGGAVAGRLHKRNLVSYLYDLHAWRITAAGREALADARREKTDGGETP